MDSTQESFEPGSSPGWDTEEPDTPGSLNRAYLLGEGDFLNPDTPSVIVPETPSPMCLRRRLCYNESENIATAALLSPAAGCETTPPATHRSKRRRLAISTSTTSTSTSTSARGQTSSAASWRSSEFVPASSLLGAWLEPPLPPPSSSSSASSSLGAPLASQAAAVAEGLYGDTQSRAPVAGYTVGPGPPGLSRGRKRASKTAGSTKSGSRTSANHHTQKKRERPPRPPAEERAEQWPPKYEEIVISDEDDDDDDDDVIVHAMVREVQMEEDEAFARSLQEQFDREEQQQQQQRRQEAMPPPNRPSHPYHHHHHHHHPSDAHLGLDWMLAWPSAISLAAFSSLAGGVSAGPEDDGGARRRGRGRSRSSRRRNSPAMPDWATMDTGAGDDYEALLAFEERQGAVAKATLSERELDSLPTKTYDPVHSAGKTQCQICFSDYRAGEQLRMLPCLHDYHVQCIDRWLKQSTTCPICRADVSVISAGIA